MARALECPMCSQNVDHRHEHVLCLQFSWVKYPLTEFLQTTEMLSANHMKVSPVVPNSWGVQIYLMSVGEFLTTNKPDAHQSREPQTWAFQFLGSHRHSNTKNLHSRMRAWSPHIKAMSEDLSH